MSWFGGKFGDWNICQDFSKWEVRSREYGRGRGGILKRRNKQNLLLYEKCERKGEIRTPVLCQFLVGHLQKGCKGQSEVLVAMFWG